jgi:7,8-dihydroneopterin aldolase/epimerase/oxygenase
MKIKITNLEFEAIIGILDHERENRQKVIINCDITYSYKNDFLDYAQIITFLEFTVIDKKFLLIEDALSFLSAKLHKKYKNISKIKLQISKPNIINNAVVSVSKKYKF